MPIIGSITEEGKTLVPVYIEGEGSAAGGSVEVSDPIPVLSNAIAMCGSFYSSTFYGLIAGPGGSLSSVTWNRTSDPVVKTLGVTIPSTTVNPQSSGFMCTIGRSGDGSSSCNDFYISQIEGEELKEGTLYVPNQRIYDYYHFNTSTSNYSNAPEYMITTGGGNLKIHNQTSKDLIISISGEFCGNIPELPTGAYHGSGSYSGYASWTRYEIGSLSTSQEVKANSASSQLEYGEGYNSGYMSDQPYNFTITIAFA